MSETLLVDVKTTARLLSICEKTLWTLTDRGDIPCIRIGRSVRYSPDDLRAWIARTKTTGPAAAPAPLLGPHVAPDGVEMLGVAE